MKKFKRMVLASAVLSMPLVLGAIELSEIDISEMPNIFESGQVADANAVNENFEFLRGNLEKIKDILVEKGILFDSTTSKYSGTYAIRINEVKFDSCGDSSIHSAVMHSVGSGTGVSDGNTIVITGPGETRDTLQFGFDDEGTGPSRILTETRPLEGFTLSISANGQLRSDGLVVGNISLDGNVLSANFRGTEEDAGPDCTTVWSGSFTGIKTAL